MTDDTLCYLDGDFVALAEARISPLDRGFLFADGVYEVIPAYGGRAFLLERHLQRLKRSLAAIRLRDPVGPQRWPGVIERLIEAEGGGDVAVYLQITRGASPRRDHRFPDDAEPTVFAYAMALPPTPDDLGEIGRSAVTLEDNRWGRCDIKSVALLANVLLRQAAEEAGAQEAILLRDGEVTEASASNVFAVIDATVVTPPLGPRLLPGMTRELVAELARETGFDTVERALTAAELFAANEVWVTSSTKEIVPITEIDGRAIGAGRPGAVWHKLRAAFDARKSAHRSGARIS